MDKSVVDILDILNNNPHHLFSKKEIKMHQSNWFQQVKIETVICEECGDICQINCENEKYFSICSNGHINYIDETGIYKYKFKIDFLCKEIIKKFKIDEKNSDLFLNIRRLGTFNKISVYFSLPSILKKEIFEFITDKLKNEVARIIITKKSLLPIQFIESLKPFGIFIIDIFENGNLDDFLAENEATIELFTKLNTMSVDLKISNLKLAATSASGDEFEYETYKIISKVFNLCIPFGNQYKGFTIPDGMISDGKSENKSRILFYDCKSFNGDEYKHKPEIPMQVHFYERFLTDFFKYDEYVNQGFVIFSNSFSSEEVRKKIVGSPQWKYVFQYFNIYYIGVEELEHLKYLYDYFYNGNYYDGKVVFNLLFCKDVSQIKNTEVQFYYQRLFPLTYEKYYFVDKREIEFAFIYGLIKGYLEKNRAYLQLSEDLIDVIISAKHDNLNKGINSPQFFDLYAKLIESIKRGELDGLQNLSSFSIFAMMKEIERYQTKVGISQLSDKWNSLLKKTIEEIEKDFIV